MSAVAFSLPVLSAVLSFVVYSLTGHKLQADIVFTSLTLFQLLRMPLILLRKLLALSSFNLPFPSNLAQYLFIFQRCPLAQ